jgi:hypothetical protein
MHAVILAVIDIRNLQYSASIEPTEIILRLLRKP